MASKVNTKFVVILGTGLLVLFVGVAVLAVKASKKVRRGPGQAR